MDPPSTTNSFLVPLEQRTASISDAQLTLDRILRQETMMKKRLDSIEPHTTALRVIQKNDGSPHPDIDARDVDLRQHTQRVLTQLLRFAHRTIIAQPTINASSTARPSSKGITLRCKWCQRLIVGYVLESIPAASTDAPLAEW